MVTAMSSRLLNQMWPSFVLIFLLAGCFGGKTQVIRSEKQQSAETALTRGIRAEQKGNYPEADSFLSEALILSSSIEDYPTRATALINLARLSRMQKDLPRAEMYADQALGLISEDSRLIAEAKHEKALLEFTKGNPESALTWAQQSIAAESGNLRGTRRNLASRIQLSLGNWVEAESLARTALVENIAAEHAEEEANSLRIMGIVARNENKNTESERILLQALTIDKRIGKSSKIAADLEELAITFQRTGNLKETTLYLERAYDVNIAAGRLWQAIQNKKGLTVIYVALGKSLLADKAGETVRKLTKQLESQQTQKSTVTISPSNKP